MKPSWYAEALYASLQSENIKSEIEIGKLFARFRKVIFSRGHERLLPFVGQELKKIIDRENTKNEVVLITADGKSQSKWAHAYDHYEKEGIIPKRAARRVVVDESIIGGFQIRMKGTLIDGSYKKSLVELYRKITSN